MKTKEQILAWLDEQPWKGEFYEEAFINRLDSVISYNEDLIIRAFCWTVTKSGVDVWTMRNADFREWYDSNNKPMSWVEYCEQNPKKEGECFISANSQIYFSAGIYRNANFDANVMSRELCEAFVAYMKLIQLRNAWVKGGGICARRIVPIQSEDDGFNLVYGETSLSFPTPKMANEFIETFKDLLEIAKPLL